ncbi:hypothetical protein H1R20_g7687, partial [Candolleomyces eurysporus]
MSEGRTPEFEVLEKIKDMPNVCHMIAYENRREETKAFQGPTVDVEALANIFHNRIAIRITMKAYGTSIDNFTSPEEMLAALRDAIQEGITAKLGERGILIDFDMSIPPFRTVEEMCKDSKSGTPIFQSIIILYGYKPETSRIAAHDYLDDVEAFFWLFCYLIFIYNPDGGMGPKNDFQKIIWDWLEPTKSLKSKHSFLYAPYTVACASKALYPGWHDVCWELFVEFRAFVTDVSLKREAVLSMNNELGEDGTTKNRFSAILENVNQNYDYILSLFDAALEKARKVADEAKKRQSQIEDNNNTRIDTSTSTSGAAEPTTLPSDPPQKLRPRTTSLCPRKPAPTKTSETPRTPKRRTLDSGDEDDTPTRAKRACPPSRVSGPSALAQSSMDDEDDD